MAIRKRFGFLALAGLLASVLLAGCGNSKSKSAIPASATIFYDHSVVFRNNSTMTTGYNGFGQLGNGNLNTQTSLALVPGLGHMDLKAAGGDHTLVAFSNNSSVYAWGSNYHGQIGSSIATTGTSAYSSTPVKMNFQVGISVVKDVAAGWFHSLAVVNDVTGNIGVVYAWGYNGYGQLGNDKGDGTFTLADSALPLQVQASGSGGPINHITQVAANGSHSLALTSGGTVYAWGNNAYGQLGKDPLQVQGTFSPSAELVQLNGAPLTGVTQIAAGGSTSYALKDGKVWAWGYNGMGQLGLDPSLPANASSFTPVQVVIPPDVLNGATVTRISAGLDHVLALLSDSSVVGWGFNGSGQVGNNNNSVTTVNGVTIDNTRIFVPVKVLTGTFVPGTTTPIAMSGVTDVIAFGTHSLALSKGLWYGWGNNGFGQLGNPISTTSIAYLLNPTLVQGF